MSPTQSTAAADLQFLLPDAHEDGGDALVPKGRAQGWPVHFPARGSCTETCHIVGAQAILAGTA